ncbi:alanine:cation symporter family protein, partial [Escherichia coli]|nr:alanine:cation symporter family protein [Escherichia coli]
ISLAFSEAFGASRLSIGLVLAALTAIIIFGGVKRIAYVSQVVVPIMAVIYLAVAIVIVIMNITEIPNLIGSIIKGAFGLDQAAGGAMGAAVMM